MSEPRLKSKLSVTAAIRLAQSRGLNAVVARKGDEDAGAILLKQNLLGTGFRVLTQIRSAEGKLGWMAGTGEEPVEEAAADAYIARQIDRDGDLWVVEIEDREGRNPFQGEFS
jgi:GMP synthase (glutamine-hydrolysing)